MHLLRYPIFILASYYIALNSVVMVVAAVPQKHRVLAHGYYAIADKNYTNAQKSREDEEKWKRHGKRIDDNVQHIATLTRLQQTIINAEADDVDDDDAAISITVSI